MGVSVVLHVSPDMLFHIVHNGSPAPAVIFQKVHGKAAGEPEVVGKIAVKQTPAVKQRLGITVVQAEGPGKRPSVQPVNALVLLLRQPPRAAPARPGTPPAAGPSAALTPERPWFLLCPYGL